MESKRLPPALHHLNQDVRNVCWKIAQSIVVHISISENESNFTLHIGDDHSQIELRAFLLQFVEGLVHVLPEFQVHAC